MSSERIFPSDGSISRLINRNRVDLPAPDRPMIPTISPSAIVTLTWFTAWVRRSVALDQRAEARYRPIDDRVASNLRCSRNVRHSAAGGRRGCDEFITLVRVWRLALQRARGMSEYYIPISLWYHIEYAVVMMWCHIRNSQSIHPYLLRYTVYIAGFILFAGLYQRSNRLIEM